MTYRSWALITGAGSGIGEALARSLAAEGVGVALVGRRENRLRAVAGQIGDDMTCVLPGDVADARDRERLCARLTEALAQCGGRLRYLVHNAGTGAPAPDFAHTDPRALEHAFAVNVTAPLALTQALLNPLRQGAPARILMVGAGIADHPQPGTGVYGISKAALARLMRQMVTDLNHSSEVDAPAVALLQPGLVDTEGLRAHLQAADACGLPHAAWLGGRLAAGDARTPESVAASMTYALLRLPHADLHGCVFRPGDMGTD